MESNTINIWCKDSFYISFLRKYINKLKHISQCFYFGSKLVVFISTQLLKLILKNQGPFPYLSSTKDVQKPCLLRFVFHGICSINQAQINCHLNQLETMSMYTSCTNWKMQILITLNQYFFFLFRFVPYDTYPGYQ